MSIQIQWRRICPDFTLLRLKGHPMVGLRGPNTDGIIENMRMVRHHSPNGWEWGYGGSGPADLALSILHHVFPAGCDGLQPVRCWRGRCSQIAWALHQALKRSLIATLPKEGGYLRGAVVDAWIDGALEELAHQVEEGKHPELQPDEPS